MFFCSIVIVMFIVSVFDLVIILQAQLKDSENVNNDMRNFDQASSTRVRDPKYHLHGSFFFLNNIICGRL